MILFEDSGLSPEIVKAVKEIGFEKLTPIQEQAIPHLLSSTQDVIASAQTGTGKTAAFGLPIIQNLDLSLPKTQALILAPTRELAIQIAEEITNYAKYLKKINVVAVYGGANIVTQINKLSSHPQIVIGTPGRTLDLIKRKKLFLDSLSYVVLDEADEMLSMGFQEDLDEILSYASGDQQTLLFSATLPPQIKSLAKKYMDNPLNIFSGELNKSSDNVKHVFFKVQNNHKYEVLKRFIDLNKDFFGIIFCRTKRETDEIAKLLLKDNFKSDAIHGDLSQAQRDNVMDKFRNKVVTILVATDVAARGIDVDDLTHVIHYQLPDDLEVFIHRSGRTGRAGKNGTSVALVNRKEISRIKQLEKKLKQTFEQLSVPRAHDIFAAKLDRLGSKIIDAKTNQEAIDLFYESFLEKFKDISKEDILKNIISIELKELNNSSLNDKSLEDNDRNERNRDDRDDSFDDEFVRLFINLGKKQDITPSALIQMFNGISDGKHFAIGRIEIENGFSFIQVPQEIADLALEFLKDTKYKGNKINIEIANNSNSRKSSGDSGRNRFRSGGSGSGRDRGRDRDRSSNSGGRGKKDDSGAGGRSGNSGKDNNRGRKRFSYN